MHVVIDGFAPASLVRSLAATWPTTESGHWHCYESGKLATKDVASLPAAATILLWRMAELTPLDRIGVSNAFPDLQHLHGAGLHQLSAGQSLGLHLDAEHHPLLPWRREASAILYLDDCEGGELEICDEHRMLVESINPRPNRLVLFSTPGCWHRVEKTMSIRRSVCLFFWTIDHTASGEAKARFA